MKKWLASLLMVMFAIVPALGQTDHGYNFYGQFIGNSTGFGVGFDSRFAHSSKFGYSVGLAYTDITWDNYDVGYADGCARWINSKGLTIPLEVNAIFGKRASKFEIGIGLTAYLIHKDDSKSYSRWINNEYGVPFGEISSSSYKSGFRPNVSGSINLGYRLQRKSGFFMKLGLSLVFGDFDCSPFDGVWLLPNVCLGYTIPHF